jgi:hypothetical protein
VLDLERNATWLSAQAQFRKHMIRSARRMSFKALNDGVRRRAIMPFLQIGNQIHGWLITFGISKNGLSAFQAGPLEPEIELTLARWKPPVRERLFRVLHLSAFLLSGLSISGQDILWITDEDEIASNVDQLTGLTKLLAIIGSKSLGHDLGHLRCATAKSDDGMRSLEDLLAYCDFAAGSVCEVATAMVGGHRFLRRDIVASLPPAVSWKARTIISWLAMTSSKLHRLTCLIELDKGTGHARPHAPLARFPRQPVSRLAHRRRRLER